MTEQMRTRTIIWGIGGVVVLSSAFLEVGSLVIWLHQWLKTRDGTDGA